MTAHRDPLRGLCLGDAGVAAVLVLIVLTQALAACGPPATPTNDLVLTLHVEPATLQVGQANLVVTVTDKDGKPVDDARVEVEGNMTHPGMAPVTAQVEGGTNGTYRLPFTWSMGGDWVISVTARLPDGRQSQADFPFSVDGG